ncbi:MAG: CRISPR-associated protein Cas4 [Cellulosilyticaceae bacterium]
MTYVQLAVVIGVGLCILIGLRPTIRCKHKAVTGMAWGRMIYSDEKGGKLLVSSSYGIQGKPDFIFKSLFSRRLTPFEIKSGQCKDNYPHEGDLMQLVAYFVIIEEVYGKKPAYGKLVYQNKTFTVRNTLSLRMQLKQTLRQMRHMLEGRRGLDPEPSYIKCRNCVCHHTVCEWEESNHDG